MAVTEALALRELVCEILLQVPAFSDLFQCALVSRLWAEETIPVLWRFPAPSHIHSLVQAQAANRSQIYTRCIRSHHLKCRANDHTRETIVRLLRNGVFGQVRAVELHLDDQTSTFIDDCNVTSLLQPDLRILTLSDGVYPDNLLDLIELHCPKLQAFSVPDVTVVPQPLTYDRLSTFVDELHDLVYLEGLSVTEAGMTHCRFHLPADRSFERLQINHKLQTKLLRNVACSSSRNTLRSLMIETTNDWQGLAQLLPLLPHLQALVLKAIGHLRQVADVISSCGQLLELECMLTWPGNWSDPGSQAWASLLVAQACPRLRKFEIMLSMDYPNGLGECENFLAIAECLGNIEVLRLPINVDAQDFFSVRAMRSMPKLTQCTLAGLYFSGLLCDAENWSQCCRTVLLSGLSELVVFDTDIFMSSSTGLSNYVGVVDSLCAMMPRLCYWHIDELDDIQRAALVTLRMAVETRPAADMFYSIDQDILRRIYSSYVPAPISANEKRQWHGPTPTSIRRVRRVAPPNSWPLT